jgi:hypothetical protein
MDIVNKTIYMTYKKPIPEKCINRWAQLNPNYKIDFSLDNDCIQFLKDNFNDYIAELFIKIEVGMYKADLWRLCKLYINSGIYADVDLVPYLNIDELDKDITFYTCVSCYGTGCFQAFMINFAKPKSPIIFIFLLSFLINNVHNYSYGPCFDMYNCLKYILNENIISDKKYEVSQLKIKINIGSSDYNVKQINLYYFPDELQYTIQLIQNPYKDSFKFEIKNNMLIVTRLDESIGWGYEHSIDICFNYKTSFYFFQEIIGKNNDWVTSYVALNNQKILDSRDLEYYNNQGW